MTSNIDSRMRLSAMVRELNAACAVQDGDDNTMWQSTWSMVASINMRLGWPPQPRDPALLDIDMHDLWHKFWHGAVNTAPESPKLDRLVLQVIQLREQGILGSWKSGRPRDGEDTTEGAGEVVQAVTSDGSLIWTDLPFLVQDMTAYWISDCAALSSAQRLSGAQFLALLAGAGAAADNALCSTALITLRETLETPRPLGRVTPTDRDPARQMQNLGIAELLPATNAWLFTAGHKLVSLSDDEWNRASVEVGRLGELVAPSALPAASATSLIDTSIDPGTSDTAPSAEDQNELPKHGGFSPQRWIWWLRRLEQISILAKEDEHASEVGPGNRTLASFAEGMMTNMLFIAEPSDGPVAQALQRPGGVIKYRPAMHHLPPSTTPRLASPVRRLCF